MAWIESSPVFGAVDGLVVDCENNRAARAARIDATNAYGSIGDVTKLRHVVLEMVELDLVVLHVGFVWVGLDVVLGLVDLDLVVPLDLDLDVVLGLVDLDLVVSHVVIWTYRLARRGGVKHLRGIGFGTLGRHVGRWIWWRCCTRDPMMK
jgi:hypothetical protein